METQHNTQPYQGWSLEDRDPQVIQSLMPIWGWFYHHYFQVQTDGWHHIPPLGKMLIVGSHNGGLAAPDMHMFMYDWFRRFGYERRVYGLMHRHMWLAFPPIAQLASQTGAVRAHPRMAIAALQRGDSVLVYPGGAKDVFRPHRLRDQICFGDNQSFIKLALREQVPILPIVSWGAHDTLYVWEDCYHQARQIHRQGIPWLLDADPGTFPIYLGLPWGLALGPIPNVPWPAQIHTRVCAPIVFDPIGQAARPDPDYVKACYNHVVTQMQTALDQLARSKT